MKRTPILILIIIVLAASALFLLYVPDTFNSVVDNAVLKIDSSCSTDSDCVISLKDCSSCGGDFKCVNKNWVPNCLLPVPACGYVSGPLASPFFSCKCVNNECAEYRGS